MVHNSFYLEVCFIFLNFIIFIFERFLCINKVFEIE